MAVGSMAKTPRSWKGSGSGFISELFTHWPLPGPDWHCQHQPTSSAHTGSSLFKEIVSISQYRRFLPLVAWPVARCALQLQPRKHLHAQETVCTRNCMHKASPSMLTWPEPESLAAHTCSCPWLNSRRTSQEGSDPHSLRGAEPLLGLGILPGLEGLVLQAWGKLEGAECPA